MSRSAPGPGLAALAWLPRLRRDPLAAMKSLHEQYGDVVRLGDGPFTVHLLGHPRHAEHVLRRRHANYDRQTRSANAVREVTGESLLTNDGEPWRRHRLLLQPLFNRNALGALPPIVSRATEEMVERWLAAGEVDLAAEMMRLTATIVTRAFFGIDLTVDLASLMPTILQETYERASLGVRWRSHRFQSGGFAAALLEIQRGNSPLLTQLRQLSEDEQRSEIIALLLAGHETTANALTWTFSLLRDEDDATHAVQESIRLYPPIWVVERHAIEQDEIDGYTIPANTSVYVSPYILHRHRDFWNEPERYDPTRFPEQAQNPAYIPFGIGPHSCIGAAFAMIEAPLVIERVRERCEIEVLEKPEPQAWITLRAKKGLRCAVRPRARTP